jgi:NAD(P)-dependent dehydrogenase (short-subunit alcohol dehydrogenase family)
MQPQVILITGASSGFGKITAQMLSEQGHIVYGTSRKPSEDMNHVKMLVVDVTNFLSVCQAVERILSEQGRIDVLINNAGIGIGGALELATEEEVNIQMNTNFFGVVNMCKAVLPSMRKARKGKIINISSIGVYYRIIIAVCTKGQYVFGIVPLPLVADRIIQNLFLSDSGRFLVGKCHNPRLVSFL